jgi:predicted glycosyltransferase
MVFYIDINHPAHVHYFKHLIFKLVKEGHSVFVSNRKSQLIDYLLDVYHIDHFTRSARPTKQSRWDSFRYLLKMIWDVGKFSSGKGIDVYLGFASPACAFWGWMRSKPSIILDDTEHNHLNHRIYSTFCTDILTPFYFQKNLGSKQISIKAYIEQLYLHSDFFKVLEDDEFESYALCRFTAYDAAHDRNVKGQLSKEEKFSIVDILSRHIKVFVSEESYERRDPRFDKFRLKINPEDIHQVIAKSSLFISEGATMASEAGILGNNFIYCNPLQVGNIRELADNFLNAKIGSFSEILSSINNKEFKSMDPFVQEAIEKDTINPTNFLYWYLTSYPDSRRIMKENPDYQFQLRDNFKFFVS